MVRKLVWVFVASLVVSVAWSALRGATFSALGLGSVLGQTLTMFVVGVALAALVAGVVHLVSRGKRRPFAALLWPVWGIVVVLGLAGSLLGSRQSAAAEVLPLAAPDAKGWESYLNPPLYTRETAPTRGPGQASPGAAVTHFYLSRLRGDQAWEEVMLAPAERSSRARHSLEKYEKWTITKFRLVARKPLADDRFYVRIFMAIRPRGQAKGAAQEGEDEAEVQRIGRRWFVTVPPS